MDDLDIYEQVSRENRTDSPIEFMVRAIRDGHAMKELRHGEAGKLLIGRACNRIRASLLILLDPTKPRDDLMLAILQLRTQNDLLETIAETLGTAAIQAQALAEAARDEQPDDDSTHTDEDPL